MTPDLLELDDAISRVLAEVRPLPPESVPLSSAARRVLREPIVALHDVPPEAASLMDGYAMSAAEALPNHPLRVAFEIAAGHVAPGPLGPGECARIFTGAPLPPGADAVVKQEDASRAGALVKFVATPPPGEHVRQAGSDAKRGEELWPAGGVVDGGVLALAAAVGHGRLAVGPRPIVKIVATGDELVAPGELLRRGKIHESNGRMLAHESSLAGAAALYDIAPDDPQKIAHALTAEPADVVVTTGGASVGDFDFAREVLDRLGGRKVFWQVAIRPGKPVLFGVVDRGERRLLYFALPGNPGAAALTFDLFVRPALLALQGARACRRTRVKARLTRSMRPPTGLTLLVRGRLVSREATLWFDPAPQQGSMSVGSLAGLGGLCFLPAARETVESGALVDVEPWTTVDAG